MSSLDPAVEPPNPDIATSVRMRLGVVLPNESALADPREIVRLAVQAEELGYDHVWLPDHLLPPEPYGPVYGGAFEAIALLSHIAAVTRRVTLGTSVLILPLRDPVLLAKQVATVERLAPGRVVLGIGVGWEKSEFTALGLDFTERGRRTDEAIGLVRSLHSTGAGDFQGRFHRIDGGVFAPVPTAPVPVMVGGTSDAALRRAARIGDLWQAFGLTPDQFRARRATLRELAAGRPVRAGAVVSWKGDGLGGAGPEDPGPLVRAAGEWEAAGADHLAVHFGALPGAAVRMREFVHAFRPGPAAGAAATPVG